MTMEKVKNDTLLEFKKIIAELSNYAKSGNIDEPTRKVIQDLAISLKYKLEYDIINQLVIESPAIKDTIELIDEDYKRIVEYKESLYQKFKESGKEVMDTEDRIKLTSMERNLRRLSELKTCIENKNLTSYINAMNKQVTSSNQLISIIKSVLSEGYNDYFSKNLIEENGVNENVLMIVYSILKDKTLLQDLKWYFDGEKALKKAKTTYEQDQEYLSLFLKVSDFVDTFKNYMILSSKMDEYEIEEVMLNNEIDSENEMLNNISHQKYSKVLLANQIKKLTTDLENKQSRLNRIEKRKEQLEQTEQILVKNGFGEIIDAFKTDIINVTTVPQKFALFLRSNWSSSNFNINRFMISLKSKIHKDQVEIAKQERELPKRLDSITPLSKRLITSYHDDVEKIIHIYESENDISKLIAFYVLNLLCSAQKFSISELYQVYSEDEGLPTLYEKLNSNLAHDVNDINMEIADVENNAHDVFNL